jgi:hypothetical protein
MSESADIGTAPKGRGKKVNGIAPAVAAVTPVPPAAVGTTNGTIQIGFPTDAIVACPTPFQAMGTNVATTVMAPTCRLYTPNGILTGTLDATPTPPFTWSYTFTDPIPLGVPLAVVVNGTTAAGTQDEDIQPFQAAVAVVVCESLGARAGASRRA